MDGTFELEINSPKHGKHTFRCPLNYERSIRSKRWNLKVQRNGNVSAAHSVDNQKSKGSITLGRFIYELTGKVVPLEHVVAFKDGDQKNCVLENLFTIPQRLLSTYAKVRMELKYKKGQLRDQEQP